MQNEFLIIERSGWSLYSGSQVRHCRRKIYAADILRGLDADAESAIPMLLEAMQNDPDNQVRAKCVFVMIDIGDVVKQNAAAAVVPLIKLLLTDENAEIRSLAACGFGATKTITPGLLPAPDQAAIQNKNEDVRQAA